MNGMVCLGIATDCDHSTIKIQLFFAFCNGLILEIIKYFFFFVLILNIKTKQTDGKNVNS